MIKRQGSITVESSMVIPFVVIVVATLIIATMAMLLRVRLQATVEEVGRDFAKSYSSSHNPQSHLYWRFYDNKESDKEESIAQLIETRYNHNLEVTVDIKRNLLGQTLTIRAEDQRFKNFIFPMSIIGYTKLSVTDTPEMMRNFDLIKELVEYIPKAPEAIKAYEDKRQILLDKLEGFYGSGGGE